MKKNKPPATQRRYTCEANRFKTFGGPGILLKDITPQFLRNYEQHEIESAAWPKIRSQYDYQMDQSYPE